VAQFLKEQKMSLDENLHSYLYSSIGDIQNTIRAIDTKVGFLLVFLGLPITSLTKIYNVLISLYGTYDYRSWKVFILGYTALFGITWFLSFLAAIRSLISIHNPASHLKRIPKACGTYFTGGLFKHKVRDLFFENEKLKSKYTVEDMVGRLPKDGDEITQELVFEQMKLAYIRDTKIHRQNWAYIIAFNWLIVGFVGQMMFLLTR
jgi:hypothetical protein